MSCSARPAKSAVGGGTYPGVTLDSWSVALDADAHRLADALRQGDPPVVGRIEDDRLHLDLRTVEPREEPDLVRGVLQAMEGLR